MRKLFSSLLALTALWCCVGQVKADVTVTDYNGLVTALGGSDPTIIVNGTITVTTRLNVSRAVTIKGEPGAVLDGGGTVQIMQTSADITLENLTFSNGYILNSAGGAIVANDGVNHTVSVYNCWFKENKAVGTNANGSAVNTWMAANYSSTFNFVNCAFTDNTAQKTGHSSGNVPGAVNADTRSTVNIYNSIFHNNKYGTTSTAYSNEASLPTANSVGDIRKAGACTLHYCWTTNSSWGSGSPTTTDNNVLNKTAAQLFADYANNKLYPPANYSGRDAGTSSGITLPDTDIAGNPRVVNTVDIGPYEEIELSDKYIAGTGVTSVSTPTVSYGATTVTVPLTTNGSDYVPVDQDGVVFTQVSGADYTATVTNSDPITKASDAYTKTFTATKVQTYTVTVTYYNSAISNVSPELSNVSTIGLTTTGEYLAAANSVITFKLNDGYENPTATIGGIQATPTLISGNDYSLAVNGISAATTVRLDATQKTYTITVAATGVDITYPTTTSPYTVLHGGNFTLMFTPKAGYHSPYVSVNGVYTVPSSSGNNYLLSYTSITEAKNIVITAYPENVIPVSADTYVRTYSSTGGNNYSGSTELWTRGQNGGSIAMQFNIPAETKAIMYNKAELVLKYRNNTETVAQSFKLSTIPSSIATAINDMTGDDSKSALDALSGELYSGTQTPVADALLSFDVSSAATNVDIVRLAYAASDGTKNSQIRFYSLENGNPNYVPVLVFSQPAFVVGATETKSWNTYTAAISGGINDGDHYGDIIINATDNNCGQLTDASGSPVNGAIKFVKTFTPSEWYPIGFPFALNGVYVDAFKDDKEGPWVVAHKDNVVGDYWLKTYEQGTATVDQWADTIVARTGYAIAFPWAFEDNEVTFISASGVNISNAGFAPSGTATYAMVANPTLQNITLADGGDYYYYTYVAESKRFLRIASGYGGSSTVHPFESFIVAYTTAPSSLRSSFSVEEATDIPYLRDMEYLDDPIVKTEYYNLQGQKYPISQRNGISNGTPYIVKTITQSGKVTSRIEIR
jgi:hypothetical protein